MDERVVRLNGLAQRLRPLGQGVEWFEGLSADEQVEVLQDLRGFCIQARATAEDGPESVRLAGIRPTHTPAVLLERGQLPAQLTKIVNLPQSQRVAAFRLLVALLGVADKRRREQFCADGCTHTWHQLAAGTDTELECRERGASGLGQSSRGR